MFHSFLDRRMASCRRIFARTSVCVVVMIGIRHIMQNSLKTNHPSMNIFKRFEAVNVPNGPCVWVW